MSAKTHCQTLVRLFQTVRYLRLRQIVFQLWYRLYRGSVPKMPDAYVSNLQPGQAWIPKPACWEPGAAFTFLNERREYAGRVQWEQPGAAKLWLYNLHYFDCLGSTAASGVETVDCQGAEQGYASYQRHCEELVSDWIVGNPAIAGTGWEPYPVSLRIVNWIKWHCSGQALSDAAVSSLALQTRWLASRLEYHILANHLFANAKALVFAGLFFDGRQAKSWLAKGLYLVSRELAEQVLEDGAHYERSPMYHSILLEDVLDMLNLAHRRPGLVSQDTLDQWQRTASRMLQWQDAMSHPDGDIGFFNDAALGIARNFSELSEYANRLGIVTELSGRNSTYLAASGYGVMRKGLFTVFAKVADILPQYQPGHAHADSLSCEISFGNDRLLVNAGTSTYEKGCLRNWQRSTGAHNTLELAGQNSSDVWGGFRVGRRARITRISWADDDNLTSLQARHDGYRFLPSSPVHTRRWVLGSRNLQVIDRVSSERAGAGSRQIEVTTDNRPCGNATLAVVRWLLHPTVEVLSPNILRTASGHELEWSVDGGEVTLVPACWYPEFGVERRTRCLLVKQTVDVDFELKFTLHVRRTHEMQPAVLKDTNTGLSP